MQVIVTGMHRSGTSVVTRLLAESGCSLGNPEDLMPPKPDNPAGFWEHMRAYEINREILAAVGVDWDTAAGREIDGLSVEDRSRFATAILDFIADMEEYDTWAVKDPRLSMTFPLWRPLLSHPVMVLCLRNPIEIGVSLHGRNGYPISLGVSLWEAYTIQALEVAADVPVVTISYNELLRDPGTQLRRLVESINVAGNGTLIVPGDRAVESIIQPGLHRSRSEREMESEYLTEHRRMIWDLARHAGERCGSQALPKLSELSRSEILGHRNRAKPEIVAETAAAVPVEVIVDRLERAGNERARETERRIAELGSRFDGVLDRVESQFLEIRQKMAESEDRIVAGMQERSQLRGELEELHRELKTTQAELARYKSVLADYQSSVGGRVLDWWWRLRSKD